LESEDTMNWQRWRIGATAVMAAGALLGAAACGSSSSTGGTPGSAGGSSGSGAESPTTTVATRQNSTLGATVLVNAKGQTLYTLSAEQHGRFICTSTSMIPGSGVTCTSIWHPLMAHGAVNGAGVSSLGTIARPDGGRQVTYRGLPLYTFAQDQQPGQAAGNGLRDVGVWHAATVGASSAPPSSSSGGGGGYGYGY
jgi:predicted lipoprotein with Yx(FWY)xxD motif